MAEWSKIKFLKFKLHNCKQMSSRLLKRLSFFGPMSHFIQFIWFVNAKSFSDLNFRLAMSLLAMSKINAWICLYTKFACLFVWFLFVSLYWQLWEFTKLFIFIDRIYKIMLCILSFIHQNKQILALIGILVEICRPTTISSNFNFLEIGLGLPAKHTFHTPDYIISKHTKISYIICTFMYIINNTKYGRPRD